jgi:hypothetical protein
LHQAKLSSPGLTGRPSIPEPSHFNINAAAYWITRSSRVTTSESGVMSRLNVKHERVKN